MNESRYAKASGIVHELLELTVTARAVELAARCGDDSELRQEVDWLLRASEDEALDAVPSLIQAATSEIAAEWRVAAATPNDYQLIRPLGEGGMGVVWLAERAVRGTSQQVALKRLHVGSTTHRQRLLEEQQILARLSHPNIARLLDAGVDRDGVPFLAMEFVDGERIDDWCFQRGLDLPSRLHLFIKTCEAVAYAHQQLIIHRDLKPANVLIDAHGEPKLLDFGIAKLIDAEAAGGTATRIMTPAYASPEQLEGKSLGTTTDVWSLGVLLYELLSGARPLQYFDDVHARALAMLSGTGTTGTEATAVNASATAGALNSLRIPADIDAIVRKALRREPEQRYGSVRELVDDLERFLCARPVLARQGQWSYRAQRFVQRNRWPLAAALGVSLLTAVFTWRTAAAEREARWQAEVANRTTEVLISAFELANPAQSERHDYSAREVLDRARANIGGELADQPKVRARLLEALGKAYQGIKEGDAGAELLESAARLQLDPAVGDALGAARSLRAKATGIIANHGPTLAAEDAARRAFDLVLVHGEDDPLLLAEAYGVLAFALDGVGQEGAAIAAAQSALALREQNHAGPNLLAQSYLDLCSVMTGAGHRGAALDQCERALALIRGNGGRASQPLRTALQELEVALVYNGQYDRGLRVARERIALTAELFGERSSVLAGERLAMTDRLAESGLFAEADQLIALGMPVILERNGARSSQYAQALFHAGWLEFLRGRDTQALPLIRQALEIQESLVEGRDLGMLQVLRTARAQVLIESGQASDEARALLETVISERSQGDANAVALAYARLPLAQWHAARNEAAAALSLLDQVAAVGGSVEQELHARAAATRAQLLRMAGDHAGAAQQAKVAFDLMLADRGSANPRTIRYAVACAAALAAAGDLAEADQLLAEYRPRLEQSFPEDSRYRSGGEP